MRHIGDEAVGAPSVPGDAAGTSVAKPSRKRGLYFNLEKHISTTRVWLNSIYATEAPRKAARIGEIIPFASDASETSYCWYSAGTNGRVEPAIYVADFKIPPAFDAWERIY